ncbi:MAG: class II aldolase/adducin family protein [Chloroflexota bacterium]|nr:class II aldolase/adducin family protein [Chloroflexota bacterium]
MTSSRDLAGLKQELVDGAALVASIGLVPLTQGNLSLRDPDSGLVLMTPHDYPYDQLTTDDVLALDLAGEVIAGEREPSHETQVHLAVYERRPDALGIVHAEPIYTNLFGVLHKPIAPLHVGTLIDVGGEVPVMPFAPSGSRQFGYDMLDVMGDRNAVIWANHGMLALGGSLAKAIHCTVMVEISAQLYHMALQHGEPHQIPERYHDLLVG